MDGSKRVFGKIGHTSVPLIWLALSYLLLLIRNDLLWLEKTPSSSPAYVRCGEATEGFSRVLLFAHQQRDNNAFSPDYQITIAVKGQT